MKGGVIGALDSSFDITDSKFINNSADVRWFGIINASRILDSEEIQYYKERNFMLNTTEY